MLEADFLRTKVEYNFKAQTTHWGSKSESIRGENSIKTCAKPENLEKPISEPYWDEFRRHEQRQ